MVTSEQIGELAAALAKAQGEMGGAKKDAANPFFKSKYADLASVWEACRAALSKNGLCVVQAPSADGPKVSVETMLAHTSGQWIKDTLTVQAKDDGPQAVGSAITYLRRYAMQGMTGVAPEDDDGNEAQPAADSPRTVSTQPFKGGGSGGTAPTKPQSPPATAAKGNAPKCPTCNSNKDAMPSKFEGTPWYCKTCRKGYTDSAAAFKDGPPDEFHATDSDVPY